MVKQPSTSEEPRGEFSGLPLEKQMIQVTTPNGEVKMVSALSKGFVEARHWTPYRPPGEFLTLEEQYQVIAGDANTLEKLALEHCADIEEWTTRMTFFKEDLNRLLRLPYHRFWSHAIMDDNLHSIIDTYLRLVPRFYDLHSFCLTEEMKQIQQDIHSLVLRVIFRMATYKESKRNHISPEAFAELIYNHFVFDVPKLLDIVVVFWKHDLLEKMIQNLFKWQPNYIQDLSDFEANIHKLIDELDRQIFVDETVVSRPKSLTARNSKTTTRSAKDFSFDELYSITQDVLDMVSSLSMIMEYVPAAMTCLDLKLLLVKICSFFEHVYPTLKEEVMIRTTDESLSNDRLVCAGSVQKQLTFVNRRLIHWFRLCLLHLCFEPLARPGASDSVKATCVESFFEIICEALAFKTFIISYEKTFRIEKDLQLFKTKGAPVDQTRSAYILQSVSAVFKNRGIVPPLNVPEPIFDGKEKKSDPNFSPFTEDMKTAIDFLEGRAARQFRETFPNASEQFVHDALEYYRGDCNQLINAIFDQNLPPNLQALFYADAGGPSSSASGSSSSYRQSNGRSDHSEPMMTQIGKRVAKPKKDGLSAQEKKAVRDVAARYALVEDEEQSNMYDDEYDDTYDSNDVGLPPEELTRDDELQSIRPFTTPRVLATNTRSLQEEDDESDEELSQASQASSSNRGGFIPFCTNPEEVRRRREEARAAGRGRGGRGRPNVSGSPRGQGQSDDTQKGRLNKERNKSHGANHNRRQQSDFKRNRF